MKWIECRVIFGVLLPVTAMRTMYMLEKGWPWSHSLAFSRFDKISQTYMSDCEHEV